MCFLLLQPVEISNKAHYHYFKKEVQIFRWYILVTVYTCTDTQTGKWSFTLSETFLLADTGLLPSVHFLLRCPSAALQYSFWQFFHVPTVHLQKPFLIVTQCFPLDTKHLSVYSLSFNIWEDLLIFSALQIPPSDICELLPHFLFDPLAAFYLYKFISRSLLTSLCFLFRDSPSFNKEIQEYRCS